MSGDYAATDHAPRGRLTEVAGTISVAAMQHAHAVLAGRGVWVTNEKTLLERAGLRGIDDVPAGRPAAASPRPDDLDAALRETRALFDSVCPNEPQPSGPAGPGCGNSLAPRRSSPA